MPTMLQFWSLRIRALPMYKANNGDRSAQNRSNIEMYIFLLLRDVGTCMGPANLCSRRLTLPRLGSPLHFVMDAQGAEGSTMHLVNCASTYQITCPRPMTLAG